MTDNITSIDPHDNIRKMLKRSNKPDDLTRDQYKEKFEGAIEQSVLWEERYNELFDVWAASFGCSAKDWIEIGMDIANQQHKKIGEEWRDVSMSNFDTIVHEYIPVIKRCFN